MAVAPHRTLFRFCKSFGYELDKLLQAPSSHTASQPFSMELKPSPSLYTGGLYGALWVP